MIRETNGTKSAAECAIIYREALETDLNLLDPNNPKHKERVEYAQDVLGLSPEDADKFQQHTRQAYETFLALPDNHPAEIVEGIPDILCEGCAIGKHCRRLLNELGHKPHSLTGDGEGIWAFLLILKILNSQREDEEELLQPTISYEQAHFSDAEPQQVRRVKTTIGTIRRVLIGKGM